MDDIPSTSSLDDERNKRLVEIFDKQINIEIARRMEVLSQINTNIGQCQQNLDRLRKEATNKFYMDLYKDYEVQQPSIHPAVQKLIGKRPAVKSELDQFLHSNVWNWKREMRKKQQQSSKTHKKTKGISTETSEETTNSDETIQPRYIPPTIPGNPEKNSPFRGNARKMHMRVLVGNISKRLDLTTEDSATHKWMVYVRSAPGSLSVEKQVSKVRFFLHPSYKPHDIVTAPSPPFTLHRRGWGEFPMKVQLYFKNHMNKSVDIIHILKLTGANSGHHSRSVETFSDLWIYPNENETSNNSSNVDQHILSIASNMLKEDIPEFTTEARCHRCLSISCVCPGGSSARTTSRCQSDESDSSESDNSLSGAQFLGRINIDPFEDYNTDPAMELDTEFMNDTLLDSNDEEAIHSSSHVKSVLDPIGKDNYSLAAQDKQNDTTSTSQEELATLKIESTDFDESNLIPRNHEFDFDKELANCFDDLICDDYAKLDSSSQLIKSETDSVSVQEWSEYSWEAENKTVKDDHESKSNLCLERIKQEPEVKQQFHDIKVDNWSDCGNTSFESSLEKTVKYEKIESNEDQLDNNKCNLPSTISQPNTTCVEIDDLLGNVEDNWDFSKNDDVSTSMTNNKRKMPNNSYLTVNDEVLKTSSDFKRARREEPESYHSLQEIPVSDFIDNYVEEVIVEIPEGFTNRVDENSFNKLNDNHSEYTYSEKSMKDETTSSTLTNSDSCTTGTLPVSVGEPLHRDNTVVELKDTHATKVSSTGSPLDKCIEEVVVDIPEDFTNRVGVNPSEKSKVSRSEHSYSSNSKSRVNISTNLDRQVSGGSSSEPVNSLVGTKNTSNPKNIKTSLSVVSNTAESKVNQLHIVKEKLPVTTSKNLMKIGTCPNSPSILQNKPILVIQNKTPNKINQPNACPSVKGQPISLLKNAQSIKPLQSLLLKNNIKTETNNSNETNLKTNSYLGNHSPKNLLVHPPQKVKKPINASQANHSLLRTIQNPKHESLINSQGSLIKAQIKQTKLQPNLICRQSNNASPGIHNVQVQKPGNMVQKKFFVKYNVIKNINNGSKNIIQVLSSNRQLTQPLNSVPIEGRYVNKKLSTPLLSNSNSLSKIQPSSTQTVKNPPSKIIVHSRNCLSKQVLDTSIHKYSIQKHLSIKENNILKIKPNLLSTNEQRKSVNSCSSTSGVTQHQKQLQGPETDQNCQISNTDKSLRNNLENSEELVSLDEVRTYIRFPNKPSLHTPGQVPPSPTPSVSCKEPILSPNSLHSELNEKVPQDLLFTKKVVGIAVDRSLKESASNVQVDYFLEQVRLLVNTCKFEDVEFAVKWLVRGLPLVHSAANLASFKMVHPYCAPTLETFCAWSGAKQAACEWLRAKTVARLLTALQVKGSPLKAVWSTKAIFQWARFHGYSPTYMPFKDASPLNKDNEVLIQQLREKCCRSKVIDWMNSVSDKEKQNVIVHEEDEEIDVESLTSSRCTQPVPEENDPGLPVVCGQPWVCEAQRCVGLQARCVGARLALEPLQPEGPHFPVAATVLTHLAMIFTEDLLRRSLAAACHRGANEVENGDVCTAVLQREEFDIFSNLLVKHMGKDKHS